MTRPSILAALAGCCLAGILPVLHCSSRIVDAVDLGASPADGDANGPPGADAVDAGTGPSLIWPNATSSANSDPWISSHHDEIREMHPRLLVLDFYDGDPASRPVDPSVVGQVALRQIEAIAEGSRYHGYTDPSAPAFLQYDLLPVVNLSDNPAPAGWTHSSSSSLPVDPTSGAFDLSRLFAQSYAVTYGVVDPLDGSRYLNLCELFERGVINELWLAVGDDPPRQPGLFLESKQKYDSQNRPIAGSFEADAGYSPYPGPPVPQCKVTVRIAHLDPRLEAGCDLIVRSIGIENTRLAIPYMQSNSVAFTNHDFDTRFGKPFASWEDLCGAPQTMSSATPSCIGYPTELSAQGRYPDGGAWQINPFIQGCGTAHFPPNARSKWDYMNDALVKSRCEHFGMHDDADGGDILDEYQSDKVAAYTQRFGNPDASGCGGGWQVYYRQSMPGLSNQARAADGTTMKNWWPFLFY